MLIPSGTFTMGCTRELPPSDSPTSGGGACTDKERPAHKVTITHSFYLMTSEVTQSLYKSLIGKNPSKFKGDTLPVENVSWYDAIHFANALSKKEGLMPCYSITAEAVTLKDLTCKGWRLPTEAEWEYAARGGRNVIYAGSNSGDEVAWYGGNSENRTHKVCARKTNGYGLCDMSGNVWEWVWDGNGEYSGALSTDPKGDEKSSFRVLRGGGWTDGLSFARVSHRFDSFPQFHHSNLGFRLLRP